MTVLAAISSNVMWTILGSFALCGLVIAWIALSMRNPKVKK